MSIWGFDAPVLPVLRHCSTIHAERAVGRGAGSSCTDGRYRGLCVALGGEGAGTGPHCLRAPPDRGLGRAQVRDEAAHGGWLSQLRDGCTDRPMEGRVGVDHRLESLDRDLGVHS